MTAARALDRHTYLPAHGVRILQPGGINPFLGFLYDMIISMILYLYDSNNIYSGGSETQFYIYIYVKMFHRLG